MNNNEHHNKNEGKNNETHILSVKTRLYMIQGMINKRTNDGKSSVYTVNERKTTNKRYTMNDSKEKKKTC